MSEPQQAKAEGWFIVEIMGHQRHIGYVTTEAYGAAVLFRCDSPELPERDFVLARPESIGYQWVPAGAKVRRESRPAQSVLIGPSSVYRMTPCTEEAARQAIEKLDPRPLICLEMPAGSKALAAAAEIGADYDCCAGNTREGHESGCPNDTEDEV